MDGNYLRRRRVAQDMPPATPPAMMILFGVVDIVAVGMESGE